MRKGAMFRTRTVPSQAARKNMNEKTRTEKDRFGNAVRYQHHGFPAFFPNAMEINVHLLSRYGIERAKRLVHQENGGIGAESGGNSVPLLHPSRKLKGIFVFEAGQADHFEQAPRAGGAQRLGLPPDLQRQHRVS